MKRIQYHQYGGPDVLRLEDFRPPAPGPRRSPGPRASGGGPFRVLVGRPVPADLEAVARAAGEGTLRLPIARAVPLARAIPALTTLELDRTPNGGKLVITTP